MATSDCKRYNARLRPSVYFVNADFGVDRSRDLIAPLSIFLTPAGFNQTVPGLKGSGKPGKSYIRNRCKTDKGIAGASSAVWIPAAF